MTSPTYDVIGIGLGGMGSAAAAHLARRGQRVLGVERFGRAHDRGSSHGETRMVRHAYFEHADYVPLLTRAYALWDELGETAGRPVLTRTGGLMIGAPDSAVVHGSVASAELWNIPHERLSAAETRARYPTVRIGEAEVAVFEPSAGFVSPEDVVDLHCAIAADAGATLRFDTRATSWRATPGGVAVTLGEEVVEAAQVVLAVGAWAPGFVPGLPVEMVVERHVQYWFPVSDEVAAQWQVHRHPVFMWEIEDGTQFYGFPLVDGRRPGVKGAFFRGGAVADPDRLDTFVAADEIAEMYRHVAPRLAGLGPDLLAGEPCLYTVTPDHQFIVDRHPEVPPALVVAGFSGHGFKFVPVIGQIVADLVIDGATELPIDAFSVDPDRRRREVLDA